ncbi:MAG TPA: hypothetical protein VIL37_20555 [Natronosporangium sp.]
MSAAIVGALVANDLVRLATTGRLPAGELRHTAFAAAAVLTALGLTGRYTQRTLELARRIEFARAPSAGSDNLRSGRHTGARRTGDPKPRQPSRPRPRPAGEGGIP